MKKVLTLGALLIVWVSVLFLCYGGYAATSAIANEEEWFDDFYPYRIEINLDGEYQGRFAVDLSPDQIMDALAKVCPDFVDIKSFAFEKAALVDPASNEAVGGFKIIPEGENLALHGDFDLSVGISKSPWRGFDPENMWINTVAQGNKKFNALWVSRETFSNPKMEQPLALDVGSFYLLEYMIYHDLVLPAMSVGIYNPEKKYFARLPATYSSTLKPHKQWTKCSQLYLADTAKPYLKINMSFVGKCGTGDINLHKVALKLVADVPRKTSKLHLYYVARAGAVISAPSEDMKLPGSDLETAKAKDFRSQCFDFNPGGVVAEGKYVKAWTVPSDFPLKPDKLLLTKPLENVPDRKAKVELFKGGAATLLIAIKTGTPLATIVPSGNSFPVKVGFERLAGIPVYDGPFEDGKQLGKLIETRLDPLMPLNDELIPPDKSGIQVVAVTFSAGSNAPAGVFEDNIKLLVRTQVPEEELIEIPVEVKVLPVVVKPMHHFGTLFAGTHFYVKYKGGENSPFSKDNVTVAEFHGFNDPDMFLTTAMDVTEPVNIRPSQVRVRRLARKYYHRMLDYCLIPQNMTIASEYKYRVIDRGKGKAPKLTDWNFTDYDSAIDEFIIGRDVPWLTIYHTNGHAMYQIRLIDGITYSFEEPKGDIPWKKLPEKEYYKLVGNYFDGIARHLAKKGCLNRAIFVIDECNPSTYEVIYNCITAMKKKKYAKRIKISHTTYKPGTYTQKLPGGDLILDDILDVPMPDNDDNFNFFEPEYNTRRKTERAEQWVYYVETDHMHLHTAGLSNIFTPLKLRNFGASGWYCWGSFIWSIPYPRTDYVGPRFVSGQVVNPWLNPYYHHGYGELSFFYPPDPRGPVDEPVYKVIPSYRLALMRDGIQLRGLLEVLSRGIDDSGKKLKVNKRKLAEAEAELSRLWADNPVQWYLSYASYQRARDLLYEAVE